MMNLARILVILGLILLVLGGAVYLAGRLGLPLGRLPGDIQIQTNGASCVFPLATMIILSVFLTVLLNVIARLLR